VSDGGLIGTTNNIQTHKKHGIKTPHCKSQITVVNAQSAVTPLQNSLYFTTKGEKSTSNNNNNNNKTAIYNVP